MWVLVPRPAALKARLLQDPGSDRNDETRFLGDAQKFDRGELSTVGVVPAQQRFDAADHPGPQIHDRLVHDAELGARDRPTECRFGGQPRQGMGVEIVVEELDAVPTALLGSVHRGVRVAHERVST